MSINSQILATMESEGIVNDEGLDLPGIQGSPHIQAKIDHPAVSANTPITDELKKRLLSPSTTYTSIKDGIEKVNTMEDVHGAIATQGAISFADAEEVAMTFESFGPRVSLKEFTKLPSQINYQFTKRLMAEEIKVHQENIATASENFFDGQIEDAEEAFEDYRSFYGKNLVENLQTFRNAVNAWLTNHKSIPSQIFQTGSDFVNLATVPLSSFPKSFEGPNKESFCKAVDNLRKMIEENIHVKNLLITVKEKKSFGDFIDPNKTAEALALNPSLVDFLQMFNDPYTEKLLLGVEEAASNGLEQLRELQKEKDFNPTDFKAVRDFVVENGELIDGSNTTVHYYIELIELLQSVYLNTSVVLDYFTVEV